MAKKKVWSQALVTLRHRDVKREKQTQSLGMLRLLIRDLHLPKSRIVSLRGNRSKTWGWVGWLWLCAMSRMLPRHDKQTKPTLVGRQMQLAAFVAATKFAVTNDGRVGLRTERLIFVHLRRQQAGTRGNYLAVLF